MSTHDPVRQRWTALRGVLASGAVLIALLALGSAAAVLAAVPRGPRDHSKLAAPLRYCADRRSVFRGAQAVLGVDEQLGDRGPADLQCTAGHIAADHLGYVRSELSWASVEVSPGRYDFTSSDQVMAAVATHQLSWIPIVLVAPVFRQRPVATLATGIFPPANPDDFARFMQVLVRRYGPHGSFWRSHQTLPYRPIRAWQIWNEPNLSSYWLPRPSARAYTALLRASWRAIKAVDRHAVVVAAGMPFVTGLRFYDQIYRDGGRRYFDATAFHDYSAQVKYAAAYLTMLRTLMDRHGDRRKPIWVTEFGWASSGPPSPFRAGGATPSRVSRLLRFMVKNRRALRLGRLFYYNWRDPAQVAVNWWGVNMGLYRRDGSQRPVARVIISAAARLNR